MATAIGAAVVLTKYRPSSNEVSAMPIDQMFTGVWVIRLRRIPVGRSTDEWASFRIATLTGTIPV